MKKNALFIIGIATFLVLLVFSLLFFKERTLFTDASFHLFYMINEGNFQIQHYRFVAIFTQFLPLLGIHLHLSLPIVAALYSSSFILLYFSSFIILFKWVKNEQLALAYLLFNIAITTHSFYWMLSELSQGMVFLFIAFGLLEKSIIEHRKPKSYLLTTIFCIFFSAFSHPLIIFPFSFFFSFYWFIYKKERKRMYPILMLFIFLFLIKTLYFRTNYDKEALSGLKNFKTLFPNYINIPSNINFLKSLISDYYFLLIFSVLDIYVLIKKKLYTYLALSFSFIFVLILLTNICYPYSTPRFYLESQYILLCFFLLLPFVYYVMPSVKNALFISLSISIICLLGIFRIYNTHQLFTNRLNWNRKFMEQTAHLPNKKLIVPISKVPVDTLMMTWASSFEFLLLSAIEQKEPRAIIIVEQNNELDWTLDKNDIFICKWGVFNYSELNSSYFPITDTTYYHKY